MTGRIPLIPHKCKPQRKVQIFDTDFGFLVGWPPPKHFYLEGCLTITFLSSSYTVRQGLALLVPSVRWPVSLRGLTVYY